MTSRSLAELLGSPPARGARRRAGARPDLFYGKPVPGLDVPGISAFYKLHLAIWQLRSQDLQTVHPLQTVEGRRGFLAWCVVHGRREYRALRELEPFWQQLREPAEIPQTQWSGGISRFMHLVATERSDLEISPDLASETDQLKLLGWFWLMQGNRELDYVGAEIPDWQRRFMVQSMDLVGSRFAKLLLETRRDVRAAFPPDTVEGRLRLLDWLIHRAPLETSLSDLLDGRAVTPRAPVSTRRRRQGPRGVNLIGYAFGELGIGEDVRMAAHSLAAADVPFTIVDFPPGDDIRQGDRSVESWVGKELKYDINIVCMTALEHLRLYAERGSAFWGGRYTIGYWPWELSKWPRNWRHCFALVDEVWASSHHTLGAASEVSPMPVLRMPMAVVLPPVEAANREKYGLPHDSTLFVFSFDGNSYVARKNPEAVIQVFQAAFPRGDEAVGLVIKCMRPNPAWPAWKAISAAAARDLRIIVIDEMMEKGDVLALYAACDCFISLHRAEGFGRGLAEALLLGLDVIATAHGGNVDFCTAAQAHLVPCRLVPVAPGEYVEGSGQYWAEPDLSAAAALMRQVVCRRRSRSGGSPADDVRRLFDPLTVGTRYRQRLLELARGMVSTRKTGATAEGGGDGNG